ncbi:DUF4062 domain-containing protein [Luteimonas sp. MJ204]|uniref:DUF4062 domain-containing protein n=1 Tax=Luteimonas sp. MJ145 TaxID=3129234 RepID=UPI0031BB3D6E
MKIFISSLISGMEAERGAARRAVELLRHQAIMAEDFRAQPNSPQVACLAGVRQADLVVLILGGQYGAKQASGLSATHEEYRAAQGEKPVLVFLQGSDPEPDQAAFIAEVSGWEQGLFREPFASHSELGERLTRALHDYELAHAQGPIDPDRLAQRALDILSQGLRGRHEHTCLELAIAAGPEVTLLRPVTMEDPSLAGALQQQALFGRPAIFDRRRGTDVRFEDHALVIYEGERHEQGPEVRIWAGGDVRLRLPVHDRDQRDMSLPFLIEEEVAEKIASALEYAGWMLSHIDPTERVTHVALAARIVGQSSFGWRTRAEHAANPNSGSMGWNTEQAREQPVQLSPAHMKRKALAMSAGNTVSDLVALLRRRWKDQHA